MQSASVRYSMNEFKPLTLDDEKIRLEQKISKLDEERQPIVDRKREIEIELSDVLAKIRTGKYDGSEYLMACNHQNNLKKEKFELEKILLTIKRETRKLSDEKEAIYHKIRKMPRARSEELALELRDKYLAFSADSTRVASMRAMAAKFVEELQILIKELSQNNKH